MLLNAGIVHPPKARETTVDGHEVVFATNVLGHFALAGELLTALAESSGRMVWVGSMSTSLTPYDPVDPQLVTGYSGWRAYVQSKIATTALGFEADRRLRAAGVPVASVVAHPGYSTSGRTPGIVGVNAPTQLTRFADNLQAAIAQSKEHGAWSLVRALVDPEVEGGEFWGPRTGSRGEPRRQKAAKITRDLEVAERVCGSLRGRDRRAVAACQGRARLRRRAGRTGSLTAGGRMPAAAPTLWSACHHEGPRIVVGDRRQRRHHRHRGCARGIRRSRRRRSAADLRGNRRDARRRLECGRGEVGRDRR